MRELKFRVWHISEKKMYYATSAEQIEIQFKESGAYWLCHDVFCNTIDRYEVMQYTGLHDSKGKEIYEGDIVKVKDDAGEEFIKQIYFLGGTFCVIDVAVMANIPLNQWLPDLKYGDKPLRITGEVIGNIYETPEKLK